MGRGKALTIDQVVIVETLLEKEKAIGALLKRLASPLQQSQI